MTSLLTCKQLLDELSEYLDGNVQDDVRSHLDKHVSECPNCWVVVDTTKRTLQIYKGMDPQPIPDELHARLMKALEKKIAAGSD